MGEGAGEPFSRVPAKSLRTQCQGEKGDMILQGKRKLLGRLQPRSDEQLMVLICLRE